MAIMWSWKAKEYLGMRITRDHKAHTITLDQTCYAEKVANHFDQENCKEVSIQLSTRYSLRPNKGNTNPTLQSYYQLVIGSLLYIMLETRPNILLTQWSRCHSSLLIHQRNTCKEHSTLCAIYSDSKWKCTACTFHKLFVLWLQQLMISNYISMSMLYYIHWATKLLQYLVVLYCMQYTKSGHGNYT